MPSISTSRHHIDHVNRNRILRSKSTESIDLIEELYRPAESYMSDEDAIAETIQIKSGLPEGGNERPSLFNLFTFNHFSMHLQVQM